MRKKTCNMHLKESEEESHSSLLVIKIRKMRNLAPKMCNLRIFPPSLLHLVTLRPGASLSISWFLLHRLEHRPGRPVRGPLMSSRLHTDPVVGSTATSPRSRSRSGGQIHCKARSTREEWRGSYHKVLLYMHKVGGAICICKVDIKF